MEQKTISEVKEILIQEESISETLLAAMKDDSRIGIQKLLERYYREQEEQKRKQEKAQRMLIYERMLWSKGYSFIGGIDEAGRGPLAGPVVSACVVLPKELIIEGVDDSKKLSPHKREYLFDIIMEKALSVGFGIVDHNQIDKVNIYQATKESMEQAVNACKQSPDYLLLDAMQLKRIPLAQLSLIGGDGKSQTIAAASIIAKVTRDKIMVSFAKIYPEYGFEKHKGYGTEEHVEAIRKHGLSPIHRKSFLTKIL
ncbi:MAG: ribonuclease HII [Clostridiales bacterium]|nr:ribonuclease HII [Clostridiales bacterium]